MLYFGDKLKALRIEKGLTQRKLAEKMGLVGGSISAYEKNAKHPSVKILMELCAFFNVSADYLLGLSDNIEFNMSSLTDEQIQLIMGLIIELEQYNKLKNKLS